MVQDEIEIHHGGQLENTAEVDHLEQLLVGQFGQLVEMRSEIGRIPGDQAGRVPDGFRAGRRREVKPTRRDGIQETHFGGGDVPRQFQYRARVRVGPIIALVERDGCDNGRGEAMFVLQVGEKDIVE